jgi:hypothetical protein
VHRVLSIINYALPTIITDTAEKIFESATAELLLANPTMASYSARRSKKLQRREWTIAF